MPSYWSMPHLRFVPETRKVRFSSGTPTDTSPLHVSLAAGLDRQGIVRTWIYCMCGHYKGQHKTLARILKWPSESVPFAYR